MGLFDFFKEPSLDYLEGQAMRDNPELLKRYFEEQDRRARQEFMSSVMGSEGSPANYDSISQATEGPMQPGNERAMQTVNQLRDLASNSSVEAIDGSGYLGGGMGDKELALRLMQGPTSSTRATGGALLNQLLQQKAPAKPSDFDLWQKNPEAYSQWKDAGRAPSAPKELNDYERWKKNPEEYSKWKDAGRAPEDGDMYTPIQRVNAGNAIRKEFNSQSQGYKKLEGYWNQIDKADKTGIGNHAAVVSFVKMLDPGSVVSGNEIQSMVLTGGRVEQLENMLRQASSGKLPKGFMKDLKSQARVYFIDAKKDQEKRKKRYRGISNRLGLDPRNVVPEDSVLPKGMTDNGDGTLTMPDGTIIRPKQP